MLKMTLAGLAGLMLAACASTMSAPDTSVAAEAAPDAAKVAVASAEAEASAAPVAEADGKYKDYDPDEIICKKDKLTGSRVRTKKVCGTRAEWAKMDENTRKRVNDTQGYRQRPDANR